MKGKFKTHTNQERDKLPEIRTADGIFWNSWGAKNSKTKRKHRLNFQCADATKVKLTILMLEVWFKYMQPQKTAMIEYRNDLVVHE